MMLGMERVTAFTFTRVARLLAAEARQRGLVAPAFRCPPRDDGVSRAIRRYPGGEAVVAVRIRDRSYSEVVADLVEGILVANGVIAASERGRALRDELVAVAEPPEAEAA
jgi:hypothetical protein